MTASLQSDTPVSMSPALAAAAAPRAAGLPAWRWVHLSVAALAMVATLPGRTHGLGLIAEPLLVDLKLRRVTFGEINFWATLLGAVLCLPCGWLIDRLGIRLVLTTVLVALGGVVLLMSQLPDVPAADDAAVTAIVLPLFALVLLTRGLGQSALSVVSLALMGKAAGKRAGLPVGIYSALVAVGFMAAFSAVKFALEEGEADWRSLWAGVGVAVIGCAILAALLVRPWVTGWATDRPNTNSITISAHGLTFGQALLTPAFWVFALAVSFYGLVAAGVSLFNQSILEERGFDRSVFLDITRLMPLVGLASNLFTGWLATRCSMGRLLAASMVILAGSLAAFPFVEELWHVYLYAVAMGVAGGMVTVLFFAIWGPAYGPLHLGKIQGAAQMLTVLASALGPWLLAQSKEHSGSYVLMFQVAAGVAAMFAISAWLTRVPNPEFHHA
jgi:MFS family permease